MRIVIAGKECFKSKAGEVFYKLTLLTPLSPRATAQGGAGNSACEKFVDKELFDAVTPESIATFAPYDASFGIDGNNTYIEELHLATVATVKK